MHNCERIASQIAYIHNQKSLLLSGLSFVPLGRIGVGLSFAYLGCEYLCYE
jgi:hypothetical protein